MPPHPSVSDEPSSPAGRPCLDLLDTAHAGDPLDTLDALRAWCADTGLVPPGTGLHTATPRWLTAFRDLRTQVAVLVRAELAARGARADPALPVALARINALARSAPPTPRAVRTDDGTLTRALHPDPGCAALLALVARDVIDLLTDPEARARLRECAADDCSRVYLDTSRGARRRWCSSERCGNRTRVARHRRRAQVARA
ncbi:CGNR zinc finger domain-containing protein [Streptomyces sp. NPDC059578]|uniref:CGNR zinc finger domain-containing protein n=1 Tax=Streptomyces sp. NPDC059578 TaxID=3346874 RepID=UPI00369B7E85